MATFELDEELVRTALSAAPDSHYARDFVLEALEKQLSVEPPAKLGAVVRTDRGLAVRVSRGEREAWSLWEGTDRIIVDTHQIGRITDSPLSEGVDT
jgi:hypothetical protein